MSGETKSLTRLCGTDDLGENEVMQFEADGFPPVAVFRLADGFFVTDDTCTHGAASLADGEVEDGEVECPFHAGCFDIRTGKATEHPCTIPIKVYAVTVSDGGVFVDLSKGRITEEAG